MIYILTLFIFLLKQKQFDSQRQQIYYYYMKSIVLLFAIFLITSCRPRQHPVIGIFTQTVDDDQPTFSSSISKRADYHNVTYMAANYVKYIEMSGAQVIPLFAYSNQSYFDQILPKINGVLFPGGAVNVDIKYKWTRNAEYVMKYAIVETKKGNPFPIWGTCLGMQLLAYLTSGYDLNAISPVRGEQGIRNTIQIQPESTLFKDLSSDMLNNLQSGVGILFFNHHFAVTKDYFQTNSQLKAFWNVQAYTTTSFNEKFLSVFKAKQYPFYGVQFHPETNLYQWKMPADRSQSGVEISQILSNKFIEIARKNTNTFSNVEELVNLSIYNYNSIQTDLTNLRIYIFEENPFGQEQQQSNLIQQQQE